MSGMRSEEELRQELPGPRDGETPPEVGVPAWEDADSGEWQHGLQTAAERAAARRRLDRLADDH